MSGRMKAIIPVLAALLAAIPAPSLAQYLPEPEPVPHGIPASETQSLEAHYWAIEDLGAALEPVIEQHENQCSSVDPQDSALMAECAESEAFLSDNISYYFSTLDDYRSRRTAVLQAAERAQEAARVEAAAVPDHEAAFRARLDPETMRRVTSHRLLKVFTVLLEARMAARGDTSPQALDEEADRILAEITPPWAKPVPPGGFTPEQEAQLSRHQLFEAYNLVLDQRIAERGDASPQAIDEEAERLLSEISPPWYTERQGGLEAMKALDPAGDRDLSLPPSAETFYQRALQQATALPDDEDMAWLFDDEFPARQDAGEGAGSPRIFAAATRSAACLSGGRPSPSLWRTTPAGATPWDA